MIELLADLAIELLLLFGLGHPDFEVREAAEAAVTWLVCEIDRPALLADGLASTDAEVRARCGRALEAHRELLPPGVAYPRIQFMEAIRKGDELHTDHVGWVSWQRNNIPYYDGYSHELEDPDWLKETARNLSADYAMVLLERGHRRKLVQLLLTQAIEKEKESGNRNEP